MSPTVIAAQLFVPEQGAGPQAFLPTGART